MPKKEINLEHKLWGGRFKKGLDEDAKKLSYSVQVDRRLYAYDLRVNQAHAVALRDAEYLTQEEWLKLDTCLEKLKDTLGEQPAEFFAPDEDIHSCVERLVIQELGDLGKKLHTGKSRNDQVITDVRLYLKEQIEKIVGKLNLLRHTLWLLANTHVDTFFPGFTHFQTAQPVVLAHHLSVYIAQFGRDKERLLETLKRTDVCPLGSGALAGNNYKLDRDMVAQRLGFSKISANSMDAVSDRDFLMEFISNASLCMTHLSRFCEELVLWSSPLIGFVKIGDDFTTGSSLMPQKKNPDIAELIRGKTGRVLGHVVGLTHIVKALPLTYNRDLQEDKEMMFDTVDTLVLSLTCFEKMIKTVEFQKPAIAASLEKGYLLATDFADYLVTLGVPFRESHEITGKVVSFAIEQEKQLQALSLGEFQKFCPKIDESVYAVFNWATAVDQKQLKGGTARLQVRAQLKQLAEENGW